MKKSSVLFVAVAAFVAVAMPLHAQGGCVNSPENPTLVLGLVGTAGAFFASARARIRLRRNSK
ncbi:MAG: PExPT-CTERM protein [Janthinobacterium lividum]